MRTALHSFALLLLLTACPGPVKPPKHGPLRAGVATLPLPSPVGTPMGGYGRHKPPGDPGSTWASTFGASRGMQMTPTARAVALSDDLSNTVLVRLDLCLTVSTLRFRAEGLLKQRGYDAALVVTSTHTHAGPSRYFHPAPAEGSANFDPVALAMDAYDPEVEARLASTIADVAAQALDARKPASVGVATVDAPEFNNDRRCENDDLYPPGYRDTNITVVRLDETDEAGQPLRPMTGFLNYAMHGTVLGSENDLMTVEAPGAMELYASDAVGVPLMYLQGSAGDVSPNAGSANGFQGVERIGTLAAPRIAEAFARAAPGPRPAQANLVRYEKPLDLSREAIGYAKGEFSEFGGIGCGLGQGNCNPPQPTTPAGLVCLPMKRRPFSQTTVVALRLEDILFASLPGEPTTAIGARVKQLGADSGAAHTLVLGYTQDHFGYILESDDYLRLGYEPSVSPWGYRFGDYLIARLGEAIGALGQKEPAKLTPPLDDFTPRVVTDSAATPALDGTVADVARLQTAAFHVLGGDPSLGTPEFSLEREEGGGFVAVMASATRKVHGGPELVVRYDALPTYVDSPDATSRTHKWTAQWETLPTTPTGRYRMVARGTAQVAGAGQSYELTSNAFTVGVTNQAGARAVATVDAAGALSLQLFFPPNPTLYDANGAVQGNYRLRDAVSPASEGARVQGGTVAATVTYPDASVHQVTLTFDATQSAYLGSVTGGAGTWGVHVNADGLTDGWGNSNGAALDATATR